MNISESLRSGPEAQTIAPPESTISVNKLQSIDMQTQISGDPKTVKLKNQLVDLKTQGLRQFEENIMKDETITDKTIPESPTDPRKRYETISIKPQEQAQKIKVKINKLRLQTIDHGKMNYLLGANSEPGGNSGAQVKNNSYFKSQAGSPSVNKDLQWYYNNPYVEGRQPDYESMAKRVKDEQIQKARRLTQIQQDARAQDQPDGELDLSSSAYGEDQEREAQKDPVKWSAVNEMIQQQQKKDSQTEVPRNIQQYQLTNQFNEVSALQLLKKGLQDEVAKKTLMELLKGSKLKKQLKKPQALSKQVAAPDLLSDPDSTPRTEGSSPDETDQEVDDFFQNFEIDDMISHKSLIVNCVKLRNQRFVLKELGPDILEVEACVQREEEHVFLNNEHQLNHGFSLTNIKIIRPWMDMLPQLPKQHVMQCYGITKIMDRYYQICDLIEDCKALPFQHAELDGEPPGEEDHHENIQQLENMNLQRLLAFSQQGQAKPRVSKNVYDLIQSMSLGNLSSLKEIPAYFIGSLLQYIHQTSLAFIHAHKIDLIHGAFNLSKVVAQRRSKRAKRGGSDLRGDSEDFADNSYPNTGLHTPSGGVARSPNNGLEFDPQDFDSYNYIVTNFEPWTVDQMIQSFKHANRGNPFHAVLQTSRLKLNRNHYVRLCKLLDLQAFGNSIIEMMVGKSQEQIAIKDKDIMMKMNVISSSAITKGVMTNLEQENLTASRNSRQLLGKRSLLGADQEVQRKAVTLDVGQLPSQAYKQGDHVDQLQREIQEKVQAQRMTSSIRHTLETQIQKEIKDSGSSVSGGIPLDSLPLNWIKQREILKILEIINKCLGPYGVNNQFEDFDTVKAFQEINKIAGELFDEAQCTYRADAIEQDSHSHQLHGEEVRHRLLPRLAHQATDQYDSNKKVNMRLTSSIMNNKNILTWLSITDDTDKGRRDQTLKDIYANLNMAIYYYPNNTVAHLNKIMFEWRTGLIRDDEVITYLKTKMRDLDPIAAELMFLIFKGNVYGSSINDGDYIIGIDNYDKKSCSATSLAQHLYYHQDIQEQKASNNVRMARDSVGGANNKLSVKMMQSLKSVYKNSNIPSKNQLLKLPKNFNPKSIFMSNNEIYVSVIGEEEMIMIDSRSGKQAHKMALPKWETVEQIEQFGPIINECAHQHRGEEEGGHEHAPGEEHSDHSHSHDSHSSDDSGGPNGSDDEDAKDPDDSDAGSDGASSCEEYKIQQERKNSAQPGSDRGKKASRTRGTVGESSTQMKQSGSYTLKEGGHKDLEQEQKSSQIGQRGGRASSEFLSGATNPRTPQDLGLRTESQESDALFSGSFSHNIQTTGGNSPRMQSLATLHNAASGSTLIEQKAGVRVSFDYSKAMQNAQKGPQGKQLRKIQVDDKALQNLKKAKTRPQYLNATPHKVLSPESFEAQGKQAERSGSTVSQSNKRGPSKASKSYLSRSKSRATSTLSERQNKHEWSQFRELIIEENNKMHELFPPFWKADNMNNGKMFALFDVAQQDRNKRYKFNSNKKELLLLYTIFAGRHTSLQVCNMKKLLNDEEVLHFAFNDFNENFTCIMVQAKNLQLYQIDFNKHEVLQKIADYPHSICMKSIFHQVSPYKKERALTQSQELKELIEHEELLGNKVLVPKINENILAIQQGTSNLIKIYSIKLKRITRQFILTAQQVTFFDELERDQEEPGALGDESFETLLLNLEERKAQREATNKSKLKNIARNGDFQSGGFLEAYKLSELVPKREIYDDAIEAMDPHRAEPAEAPQPEPKPSGPAARRRGAVDRRAVLEFHLSRQSGARSGSPGGRSAHRPPSEPNQIHLIEISPNGRMIVSYIGNSILIRMLNHAGLHGNQGIFDYSVMMEERTLNPFMPIYFDLDYTYEIQQEERGGGHEHSDHDDESVSSRSSQSLLKETESTPSKHREAGGDAKITYKIPNNIIDRVDKLSPGTIDRACYAWFNLKKWTGSVYNKNEKLIELLPFIQTVLQHPQLLFESPLRKKNRLQKIGQVFQLIRCYYEYAKEISLVKLSGLQKFSVFDQLSLTRSHEYIKSFAGASLATTNACSLFVDRKLQLYDIITEKLLFELNFPSAGAYFLRQGMQKPMNFHKIFFLENDQLIMTQDAENRLALVNIAGQIDLFGQKGCSVQNRDVTFKIEEPVVDTVPIKNDFRIGLDEQDDKKKVSDDDDDTGHAPTHVDQTFITYDEPIHSVFAAPSTSQYGYVALIGKHRFTIYDTYDNNFGGVEVKLIWDKSFRFDKQLKALGQILSLEFQQDCKQFVTGTSLGWICLWDIQEKRLARRFKVVNPSVPDAPEQCNVVKCLSTFVQTTMIYCYNVKSQNLLQNVAQIFDTEEEYEAFREKTGEAGGVADASYLRMRGKVATPPRGAQKAEAKNKTNQDRSQDLGYSANKRKASKKLEVDWVEVTTVNVFSHQSAQEKLKLGIIQEIKTDLREQFVITSFENGYILVYQVCASDHNHTYSPHAQYGPFESSKQIFIDDFCTYLGVLSSGQKEITFYTFEWQYNVKKLTKLPGSKADGKMGKSLRQELLHMVEKQTDSLEERALEDQTQKKKAQESKACNIF